MVCLRIDNFHFHKHDIFWILPTFGICLSCGRIFS